MSVNVLLTSGRTLNQGRGLEKGKTSQEYQDAVAVCELDSSAMETLGLENGDTVSVKTEFGETIVKCKLDKNLDAGMAFIPLGPYFNKLIESDTQHSGMPHYKAVEATITAAKGAAIKNVEGMY